MPQQPEDIWPVASECAADYAAKVRLGRQTAHGLDAVIVGIARNAMPHLANTLELVDEVHRGFNSCRLYVYENDSTDDTAKVLDAYAATRPWATVEHETLGVCDGRGFEKERTRRLAACRTKCQEWVRQNAAATTWTIVLDMDPHHGFSVDGLFNSIGWLSTLASQPSVATPGAMASFSLYGVQNGSGGKDIAGYDSWAARLNWWHDRRDEVGFAWFSTLLPPVGSPPIWMNSAFGGLCVYMTRAYLAGQYDGEDCEHVPFHRSLRRAGYQLYLNPGCRYVAIWQ